MLLLQKRFWAPFQNEIPEKADSSSLESPSSLFLCEKALKSRLFRFTVDQGGSAGGLKGKLLQIFECWPLKIWYRLAMLDGWLLKIVTSQLSG